MSDESQIDPNEVFMLMKKCRWRAKYASNRSKKNCYLFVANELEALLDD